MNRVFLLLIAVLLFTGCKEAIKYSPYELKGFSAETQEQIKGGIVSLGMNQQAVRYSWGAPDAVVINKPGADGKAKEDWIYKTMSVGPYKTTLTFTDGELTDIVSTEPSVKKSATKGTVTRGQ